MCNVKHEMDKFKLAINTNALKKAVLELKYHPLHVLVINIIFKKNSGKVFSLYMRCDGWLFLK